MADRYCHICLTGAGLRSPPPMFVDRSPASVETRNYHRLTSSSFSPLGSPCSRSKKAGCLAHRFARSRGIASRRRSERMHVVASWPRCPVDAGARNRNQNCSARLPWGVEMRGRHRKWANRIALPAALHHTWAVIVADLDSEWNGGQERIVQGQTHPPLPTTLSILLCSPFLSFFSHPRGFVSRGCCRERTRLSDYELALRGRRSEWTNRMGVGRHVPNLVTMREQSRRSTRADSAFPQRLTEKMRSPGASCLILGIPKFKRLSISFYGFGLL